ncbi:outer membrane lipoprotein-sorting protein [Treponema saccharophilum]|uniref:Uncharacterized protein TP-0789 domain-containing protein n=1 Tax=Treponema saccharophilum DSM 2985 TaxID=907348 RepID=H7EPJ0_9SPIR|nr:outer membrane lipoprotein-sorting protein [Treponema saccharophilum]EIC00391.1 hypothetical protein TresaDRAFT_0485 [Treponema saccharophilum DSM 2985]BDC94927.1 outer membrane lipoprotein-sorting protein [Treponema saccharophilum]
MKKFFGCALALFSVASLIPSFAVTRAEAESLLKKAEESTAFYGTDFRGSYKIEQTRPGEKAKSFEAVMYRRDSAAKWTILLTGPSSEKGKGYLQTDSNIWFYDPHDNRFTFSSASDQFRDTNANNSDFGPQSYYSGYDIVSYSDSKLGSYDCVLFDLKAKAGAKNIDYSRLRLWVTKNDGLTRKKEDYSDSGMKLRTTGIPSYQNVLGGKSAFSVPVKMVILDNLKGKKRSDGKIENESTTISISNVKFESVDDTVYTKPYLEMMSAR